MIIFWAKIMLNRYITTFKHSISHPRNVVDGFIDGEKNKFQHPFLFCLIGITVILILNSLFVDYSFTPQLTDLDSDDEQIQALAEWMEVANVRASTQFLPLMLGLIFIPMLSLPGLYFFREELHSFYSNLVLNSYVIGSSMVALLPLIPVLILVDLPLTDPFINATLPAILVASVGLWIYKQYFMVTSLMGWVKILSSYITGYVLFIVVKGFVAGVAGYMIFAIKRIMELSGT